MKQRLLYTLTLLFVTLQLSAQGTISYEYDANNRLTKVTYSSGTVVIYTYDELGNRLSKKVIGSASNIKGDVNGDGFVTITDVVAIVNYLNGSEPVGFNKEAADFDGSGEVTITDAIKVVNMILNK